MRVNDLETGRRWIITGIDRQRGEGGQVPGDRRHVGEEGREKGEEGKSWFLCSPIDNQEGHLRLALPDRIC